MFLDKSFPYRTSYGLHTIVGLFIGVSLSFILIVLKPFGNDSFEHENRFSLLAGYGFIKFVIYLVAHSLENLVFAKDKLWNWGREITFQILFSLVAIIFAYVYHGYAFNNSSFSFVTFLSFFFYFALPLVPLLVLPTLLLRYSLVQGSATNNATFNVEDPINIYIELKGENKDQIIVERKSLLFIKSIDNYAQVYFKEGDDIKYEILRGTLVNMQIQADFLIQPHRSYLVNLEQDFKLQGNSQKSHLILSGFQEAIPVARSSYAKLKKALQSIPKG